MEKGVIIQQDEDAKTEQWQTEQIAQFCILAAKATSIHELINLGRWLAAEPRWLISGSYKFFRSIVDQARNREPVVHHVIDLSQWIHQQFHVAGGSVDCVEQCISRIDKLHDQAKHVVCAGEGGKSFRHGLIENFKGDREKRPPEFYEYHDRIIKECPVPIISFPTYESDDIMASFGLTASILGDSTILETTDKDTWQTLGPLVSSHSKGRKFTVKTLMEEHKIKPSQAIDWLCLVGKNNVKGCHGIGEKKASEYLEKYGTVNDIIDQIPRTPKLGESLDEFAPRYELLKRVHTLNKFLPIVLS